jgi:hypothetical protein
MIKRDWVMEHFYYDVRKLVIYNDDYTDGFTLHKGGVYTADSMYRFVDDHKDKSYQELKLWTEKTFRSLIDESTWLMCYFGECK